VEFSGWVAIYPIRHSGNHKNAKLSQRFSAVGFCKQYSITGNPSSLDNVTQLGTVIDVVNFSGIVDYHNLYRAWIAIICGFSVVQDASYTPVCLKLLFHLV